MADPFRKVNPNDPLKIPAAAYNAFIDAVQADKARQHNLGQFADADIPQTCIVKVHNQTGAELKRFNVLALRDPVISPDDNLLEFQNRRTFKGEKSGDTPRKDRFAILMEPIAKDGIGRGVVAGVFVVQVNVVREMDAYAELERNETGHLRSCPNGLTRILWKESGTGVKWAVVRLSERPRFAIFELVGKWIAGYPPEPDGWMKMTACKPIYYFQSENTYRPAGRLHVGEWLNYCSGD